MQHAFHFNADRCAQCFACEVACKSAHDLAPHAQAVPGAQGPKYRQVITVDDRRDAVKAVGILGEQTTCPIEYVSMACMHCGQADCMAVCPAKAIYRDPEFGAVLVDRTKCIGCRYCSWACEFGAPQFGEDGLMQKCDMCIDRLRAGERPACVVNCCGGAITLEPVIASETNVRAKAASRLARGNKGKTIF